ncbi:MAG: hypothetical protein ACEQSK_06960, partial [Sphingomonadaceae bacterium]
MQDILINAAFMANGLQTVGLHGLPGRSEDRARHLTQVLDHWQGGHLELTYELVKYAPYLTKLEDAATAITGNVPGVFAYEVA